MIKPIESTGVELRHDLETNEMALQLFGSHCCCPTSHKGIKHRLPFFCHQPDQELNQLQRLLGFMDSLLLFLEAEFKDVRRICTL